MIDDPAAQTTHRGRPNIPSDRNLAMELVRVTEAAALKSGRLMGRGDKIAADQAAVDAMRAALASVDMNGIVVIGEGEKDEAPMLYIGEQVGNGLEPEMDVAVDPVDGTRLLAFGQPNAVAVVALSERGTMYAPPPGVFYMEKIAVGPNSAGCIDINAPARVNLERIARSRDEAIEDLTVVILDRPRHTDLIRQVREAGARIRLLTDGDVAGAILAAMEEHSGVDVLMGIGGAPEAVLAAAALKCVRGEIQCKLWPRDEDERRRLIDLGEDLDRVYLTNDLVKGSSVMFAATGITNGELLRGVTYLSNGARTHSVLMRMQSGTVRFIEATHNWDRKPPV